MFFAERPKLFRRRALQSGIENIENVRTVGVFQR
jgi:hypothetical protein